MTTSESDRVLVSSVYSHAEPVEYMILNKKEAHSSPLQGTQPHATVDAPRPTPHARQRHT